MVTKKKKVNKEPVFTWAFKSSKPRAGGMVIDYVSQLNEDGSVSCNCPGWVFAKKDAKGKKKCKHTRLVEIEAPEIFTKWKDGETLPIFYAEDGPLPSVGAIQSAKQPTSKIRYGRVLEIEE